MLLLTVSLDVHTSVRRIAMFVGVAEASAATAAAAAATVNACFLWPWGHSFVAFSACDNASYPPELLVPLRGSGTEILSYSPEPLH